MAKVIDLSQLFPEGIDGSRSPLPKQQQAMDLCLDPKGPKFIAYFGGYGCLRGDQKIQTLNGLVPIQDLKPFDVVKTPSGEHVQVAGSFPKGKARLYQVRHERGEFVASAEHLVYVVGRGYLPSFQLQVGDCLGFVSPREKSEDKAPPSYELDALRLRQTALNYLENCLRCYRQYGQLPPQAEDSAREFVRILVGALEYTPTCEREDALRELEQAYTHPDQWLNLLDKTHSMVLSDLREAVSADYKASLASECTSDSDPKALQSLLKSLLHHTGLSLPDDHVSLDAYPSPILSITLLPQEEWYYDLEVLSIGSYLDESGVAHHNSGKSLILCIVNIIWGVLYGGDYVIAREFMPELRRTTYKLFKELLPKDLIIEDRIADAEIRIKSQNGTATFFFVGLDEPAKLDSLNLSGVSIDEASQSSEEAMLKLQGRLRNPKGLRKMLLVGNPRGHDYIYKYFIKQDCFTDMVDPISKKTITVAQQKALYKLLIAPSTENKHLPDGYVAQMMASYSKERIERDIMGSFDYFEGMVYNEFRRDTHLVKPFRIPQEWTRVIGIDHGYTNPASWIYAAINYDGDIYIYREYYETETLIEDICKSNLRLMGYDWSSKAYREKFDMALIDPSTKARRNEKNGQKYSDYDIYLENLPKDFPLMPSNNDVTAGIDKVKTYLTPSPKTGKPKLFIFDTCTNLIDEISQYRWEELSPQQQGKSNEKEKPRKYKDHAVDALRYLVMSRPDEPKVTDLRAKKRQAPTLEGSISRELHEIKNRGTKTDPFKDFEYGQDVSWDDN